MNDIEIKIFIDTLKESGDLWESDDVKRVYGNVSLEEALLDRINDLQWFSIIITKATEAIKRRKY